MKKTMPMTTTIIGIKACIQFEVDLKLSDLRILLTATREGAFYPSIRVLDLEATPAPGIGLRQL